MANGAGTGVWSTLTNAFSNSRLHVQYQVSQNTSDATIPVSAWTTRNLNTVTTNDIGATLSANQITLASGTYFALIRVPICYAAQNVGTLIGQARLFNISSSAVSLVGNGNKLTFVGTNVVWNMNVDSWVTGVFVASGSQTFAVQSFQNTSTGAVPANITTEVYTDVNIWKIA